MLTVKPAQLNFNHDGIPCSTQFNDPYFSLSNGVEETHHVFIQGNQLHEKWLNEHFQKEHFTIAELGFGVGLNFITTSAEWIEQYSGKERSQSHLHYISFEKYPVDKYDLAQCHTRFSLLPKLSEQLTKHYPVLVAGSHRIHFDQFNITLTLILGDALEFLKKANFLAHAWYLDGFSPSKNPELWSEEIAKHVFRLTHQHGTFATYTAASIVRKNFSAVGFKVKRLDGFGHKREMLTGEKIEPTKADALPYEYKNWLNTKQQHYKNKTAIVIGAGMAGSLISAALAKRNWNVTLLEKNTSIASEGSGNPNAIVMPRVSTDHDIQSQLTLQGFLYSVRFFNQLASQSSFNWQQSGAIQLPRDEAQWKRMQQITENQEPPPDLLTPISRAHASELCNCEVSKAGWHIPLSGSLTPSLLCNTLLKKYKANISFFGDTNIRSIEQQHDHWIACSGSDEKFSADIIILANALSINEFQQTQWCKLNSKRGQITYIPQAACNIRPGKIICSDAYITPALDSQLIIGATFITNDKQTELREHEHEENLAKLASMIPSFKLNTEQILKGRAAIRAVSNDRLPIVGPASIASQFDTDFKDAALGSTHRDYPTAKSYKGLYIASGFGSRGLAWIPLCAEVLACMINNEPSPIDNTLRQAIHPNRFLMRQLIRQCQKKS